MSRRNRRRGHLHAVPDVGPSATETGPHPGRRRQRGREPDRGLFAGDETDWLGMIGDDVPPLAAMGIAQEMARHSRSGFEPPVDDMLDQLAEFGLPPDLIEESRALGGEHHAELAGLLRAATAMLAGDPVAGLLGVWEPLLDRKMNVFDAELAAAEILGSFESAMGDDLVDGLTRLVEEAGSTGRPEALVMCRMLTHLGPPEVRSVTVRTANTLATGGLKDRPWVSALGTAAFCRAYRFAEGPEQALVVEFAYGRRPHAFVVVVDEPAGGLIGLYATDEVDELAREVYLDSLVQPNGPREVVAAEAAEQLRSALDLPLCPVDEDDAAEMESLLPIVRERLRRLAAAPAPTAPGAPAPAVRHPAADHHQAPPGVAIHDSDPNPFGPHPRARAKMVHRIKVTLTGVEPAVWRRLEVPSDLCLDRLHAVLQMSFGWADLHPWEFSVAGNVYGPDGTGSAARVTIGDIAPGAGATFDYGYDSAGDLINRVRIRVEEVRAGHPKVGYPRCLTGRRIGPTADHPDEDEDEDVDDDDPFDVDELNFQLERYVRRRRR